MTRHTYKKIFSDPGKLEELIRLRKEGYSFLKLAMIFSCDPSSVQNQCKKYENNIGPIKLEKRIITPKKPKPKKDCCPHCEMLLSSEHHIKNPCK